MLAVALVVVLLGTAIGQRNGNVVAMGTDPANTGRTAGPGPDPAEPVGERWRFQSDPLPYDGPEYAYVDSMATGVAIEDGVVYFGGTDGAVHAVDLETGDSVWSKDYAPVPIRGTPAVADGMIYLVDGTNWLYAIDAVDGSIAWDRGIGEMEPPSRHIEAVFPSPVVADGVVYVGSVEGNLFAIDAATGEDVWQHPFPSLIQVAPAVADGLVVVGDQSGSVRGIDAATGEQRWELKSTYGVANALAIEDGIVYWKYFRGLGAIDAETGLPVWDYEDSEGYFYNGLALADGLAVFGHGNQIIAMRTDGSKEIVWYSNERAYREVRSYPAIADGIVYVECADMQMCALSLDDGALLWSVELGADPVAAPAVADGVVVVGVGPHDVVALGNGAAAPSQAAPTEGTDNLLTATAVAVAAEQPSVDATGTAYAESKAIAQANRASWTAYFQAVSTAINESGLLPGDLRPLGPTVDFEYGKGGSGTLEQVTFQWEFDRPASTADGVIFIDVYSSADAARAAFDAGIAGFANDPWTDEGSLDFGDDSVCFSMVNKGQAAAVCFVLDGTMMISTSATRNGDDRDWVLYRSAELAQAAAAGMESTEPPAM